MTLEIIDDVLSLNDDVESCIILLIEWMLLDILSLIDDISFFIHPVENILTIKAAKNNFFKTMHLTEVLYPPRRRSAVEK